jgi:hypothetical protein
MITLICNGFENQFKTLMNPTMVLNWFLRTVLSWLKVVSESLESFFLKTAVLDINYKPWEFTSLTTTLKRFKCGL